LELGDSVRQTSVGAYQHYWQDIRTGYFLHFRPSFDMPYWELHQQLDTLAHSSANSWPAFVDIVNQLHEAVSKG